jgi:DNA polymerase-3 subunit delta'
MDPSMHPTTDTRYAALIGHRAVARMLNQAVAEQRVRHAYVFHGPDQVGKSTLARWLAQRLLCQQPDAPCGRCPDCLRILQGAHPDVRSLQTAADRDPALGWPVELAPAARTSATASRTLGIDAVRALQRDAALAPAVGRWKVYLIVGADRLTTEAANCLLKTLEEPPPSVVLVLTVGEPGELLPTILSRCQPIRLGRVPTAEIASALQARDGLPAAGADLLARLSGGRPGWALEAAHEEVRLTDRARALDDLAERMAASYSRAPGAALETVAVWQLWWWDVYLTQQQCPDLVTNVDRGETIQTAANQVPPGEVVAYLRRLSVAAQHLLQNVNPRLAFEGLLLASPVVGTPAGGSA